MLTTELLVAISSGRALLPAPVPSSVTPTRVTPLVTGTTTALPVAAATLPPVILAPMIKFHEPGSGAAPMRKTAPGAVLSRVAVRLMLPPVRVKVPRPAVVTLPPTLMVDWLLLIVPLLVQLPASVSVPPFCAPMAPWLVQPAPLTVMMPEARPSPCAAGSAMIAPWFSKATACESMEPLAPVMVRLGPNVITVPLLPCRVLLERKPNTIVPALPAPATPSTVCGVPSMKNNRPKVKLAPLSPS